MTWVKELFLHKILTCLKKQPIKYKCHPTNHNIRMQKEYYLNQKGERNGAIN